jgi:hypothetical protein
MTNRQAALLGTAFVLFVLAIAARSASLSLYAARPNMFMTLCVAGMFALVGAGVVIRTLWSEV